MITIGRSRLSFDANGMVRLSSRIEIPRFFSDDLWYETSAERAGMLDEQSHDGFLAAILLIAMKLGEDIRVEGACSKEFFEHLPQIILLFHDWFPGELHPVKVHAEELAEDRRRTPSSEGEGACFFSAGVDSFYSFLMNRERTAPPKITHLLTVHGFDVPWDRHDTFAGIDAVNRNIAEEFGMKYTMVRTNLRRFSDPYVGWPVFYESGLSSVGLCLSKGLSCILIPATDVRDTLLPLGADSGLDLLWGNDLVSFRQDGAGILRFEKIRALSHYPAALKTMRVCWQDKGSYNCSECEKCLRTMVALYALGALKRAEAFDRSNLIRKILSAHIDSRKAFYWKKVLSQVHNGPYDLLLKIVIGLGLLRSRAAEVKRRVWRG